MKRLALILALAFAAPAHAQTPAPTPPAATFPWPGWYYPTSGLYLVPDGGLVSVYQWTATGWQLVAVRPL